MKKKRGVRRVEAYTDESGHTGLHLFDDSQPWFWTGTLISPSGVQSKGEPLLQRLRAAVGGDDLHASRLGLAKLELIASDLMAFLDEIDAHFVFTVIEKRHVATGKLADTVLDSGLNRAVSNLHYGSYGLRLILAHTLAELMTAQDQEEFWPAYANPDPERLSAILSRLLGRFLRIPVHPRLRELVGDALRWGIGHPRELLTFTRTEIDAPNLIAFSLLMAGIHDLLEGTRAKVGRFVHDQQHQFGKFMQEGYEILKRISVPTHATAWMTDIKRINTYDCQIEMLPSQGVVGLQLIDVVLWLYKRSTSDTMRANPRCASLVEFVNDRAAVRYHSKEQLSRDAERAYQDIMNLPISARDLRRAEEMVEKIDQARRQRMSD